MTVHTRAFFAWSLYEVDLEDVFKLLISCLFAGTGHMMVALRKNILENKKCVYFDYSVFNLFEYCNCIVSGHILFHHVSPSTLWFASISLSISVICNIFLMASSLSHLCTCPNHRVHGCLFPDVYISHMI